MTLLSASFEVAPAGTAVPTTGGPDGFTVGFNGAGTSLVTEAGAAVASGSFAGKIAVGSTAHECYRGWSWSGGIVHVRQYVYLTANPSARFSCWVNLDSGGFDVSRIRINTDGTVGVGNPTDVWLTTAPIPLNTLCRIEASFNHAAGTMSLDIYTGNSTTPIAGGSVSRTAVPFSTTTISQVLGGILSTLTNFTLRTDAWAVSDVARQGPVVTGGVVTGVAAPTVVASAAAGTVTAAVGETVTITGVTAQVVAQGGNAPAPPAPVAPGLWPPDPYREAIRSGSYALVFSVSASLGGVPTVGAQDLRPTGGTITDTTKAGVRRTLNLDLAPEPGLFDKLSPVGTTLTVTATVTYLNETTQDIPMGVFDVDSQTLSEGGGGLSLTAPDKWVRIQRARFLTPKSSQLGWSVPQQITDLIRGALGSTEPVVDNTGSSAQVTALVWEKDRDKAIQDLAKSIGAWVYFDRNGVATIENIPTSGASADWLIDSSASGVLTELDRERSRSDAYNVVVVDSSAADGALFPTQFLWDDDPSSPTYAGLSPFTAPETAGPFGIVTYYYDTPVADSIETARLAGYSILMRVVGLASSVSLGQVPNPAVDAFDVIDVLPPRERYDIARVLERHVVDTVTHPLTLGSAQHIEGRATRVDDIVGGS